MAPLVILVLLMSTFRAESSSKRGIAKTNLHDHQLRQLKQGVTWGYNWKFSPNMPWQEAGMEFVPMVHDASINRAAVPSGSFRGLLGFNEPDISSQANMDPYHAAGMWTNVEQLASQLGVQQLVSPAMCGDIGKGTQWMGSFLNACHNCRIDAIAIHSYWCTLDGVKNLVDSYRRFGKKIWITEIACADPRFDVSMQGQARFMQEVVPWLEQEEIIEKYAWFSYFTNEWRYVITTPNPDAGLVHADGSLSQLGQIYVNLGGRRLTESNITTEVTTPIIA